MSNYSNFMDTNLKIEPKANTEILEFINHFVNFDDQDVHNRFVNSYCYYFAKMLEIAFPAGTVCWAVPFGHLVYVFDKIPYDITGVYDGEADEFIPEKYLGNAINDFKHNNTDVAATAADLKAIRKAYYADINSKIISQLTHSEV